jgi:hypothetical protein
MMTMMTMSTAVLQMCEVWMWWVWVLFVETMIEFCVVMAYAAIQVVMVAIEVVWMM